MKDLGLANKVLGIRVTRAVGVVMLDQEQYTNALLSCYGVADCNTVRTPADPGQKLSKQMSPRTEEEHKQMENVPYRELIGGLQYLAQGTRPVANYCNSTLSFARSSIRY